MCKRKVFVVEAATGFVPTLFSVRTGQVAERQNFGPRQHFLVVNSAARPLFDIPDGSNSRSGLVVLQKRTNTFKERNCCKTKLRVASPRQRRSSRSCLVFPAPTNYFYYRSSDSLHASPQQGLASVPNCLFTATTG